MSEQLERLKQTIVKEIKSLPKDSEAIIPHIENIEIVEDPNFWNTKGRDPISFLKKRIAKLMKYKPDVKLKPASFTLKCENLLLAKLELELIPNWWQQPVAQKAIDDICESVAKLPLTINQVKEKESLINSVLHDSNFWNDISINDILRMRDELSSLMIYQQSEAVNPIIIKMEDEIQQRDAIRYGPDQKEEQVEVYREKVEKKVRDLVESSVAIQKIKNNEKITENDLEDLENILISSELNITEENLKKAYKQPKGTFVEFIKMILGLYKFPNPQDLIEEAFSGFLLQKNFMNPNQINFISILETVFLSKKHVELQDFFNPPFTNLGSSSPTPLFKNEELVEMVGLCKTLEKEVYGKC